MRRRPAFRSTVAVAVVGLSLSLSTASMASAYISSRTFFTAERYKADGWQGYDPQQGTVPGQGRAPLQGAVLAGPRSAPYRVTRSGTPIEVRSCYAVTPGRRSQGPATVNVVSAPQNGQAAPQDTSIVSDRSAGQHVFILA